MKPQWHGSGIIQLEVLSGSLQCWLFAKFFIISEFIRLSMFNCSYAYSLPHYPPTPNQNFWILPFECFKYSKLLQIIFIYLCYLGSGSTLVRGRKGIQIGTNVSQTTDGYLEPVKSIIFFHFHALSRTQLNQRSSHWQFQIIKSKQRKECYFTDSISWGVFISCWSASFFRWQFGHSGPISTPRSFLGNNSAKKSIWNILFSVGYQLLFVQLQLFHTFHFIYIMSFTLLRIGQRGLTWLVERSRWSFTFYFAFWDLILFGTDQMQLLSSIF